MYDEDITILDTANAMVISIKYTVNTFVLDTLYLTFIYIISRIDLEVVFMSLTIQTKAKIDKINSAIDNNLDLQTIKKTLFSGHSKKCIDYLEKHSDHIPNLEKLFKPKNEVILKQEDKPVYINSETINDIMELLHYKKELIKIATGDKLSSFNQVEDVLTIPNEYLKMNNLQMKTFRIERELFEEFNEICNENGLYTKTSIVNYMIYEFVQKYRK